MIYLSISGLVGAALRPLARGVARERLALDLPDLPRGAIWIHGASVGELNSARPVVAALAAVRPVVVSANSDTGLDVARGWGLLALRAPLDVPQAVGRFLDALQPSLAITIENELWPNRAAALTARGIPQALIGARMSARSARSWGRVPGLAGGALAGVRLASAQDAGTEARLLALGLPATAVAPRLNLKLLTPAATRPPATDTGRGRVWLAASTHPGEDEIALAAHAALNARWPDARLILAPRHPQRADAVAALIAARGLRHDRLGGREVAAVPPVPVLLIDRLGALDGAYAAAGVCLTGGSLVDHGGHTPWEPAAYACALLHGPHVANFAADYATLDAQGAAREVAAATLSTTLAALMADEARRRKMGAAARAALDAAAPDPAGLVAALLALARD